MVKRERNTFITLPDPPKIFQHYWLFYLVELYQTIIGIDNKEDVLWCFYFPPPKSGITLAFQKDDGIPFELTDSVGKPRSTVKSYYNHR